MADDAVFAGIGGSAAMFAQLAPPPPGPEPEPEPQQQQKQQQQPDAIDDDDEQEELRIDAADGYAYSRADFEEQYGGTVEWDSSAPTAPVAVELAVRLPTGLLRHFGSAETIGGRPTMEDRMTVVGDLLPPAPSGSTTDFFGVYDGHGGRAVADFAGSRLHEIVAEQLGVAGGCAHDALVSAFSALTEEISAVGVLPQAKRGGCTAVVAVVTGGCAGGGVMRWALTVANVGDCRSVLCSRRRRYSSSASATDTSATVAAAPVLTGLRLSVDHKPDDEAEQARIEAGGGSVIVKAGTARVGGMLACSRAFGDLTLRKHGVSSEPYISQTMLVMHSSAGGEGGGGGAGGSVAQEEETEGGGGLVQHCEGAAYLILACDGLFDAVTDSEAAAIVGAVVGAGGEMSDAAKTLQNVASKRGSMDNISILVIMLPNTI
jgi:protein phosphatase 2C family protein 2/3